MGTEKSHMYVEFREVSECSLKIAGVTSVRSCGEGEEWLSLRIRKDTLKSRSLISTTEHRYLRLANAAVPLLNATLISTF